jgi:two-component system response regulator FlrC
LRAQGLAIAEPGAAPQAGDMFLLAKGDTVVHPYFCLTSAGEG